MRTYSLEGYSDEQLGFSLKKALKKVTKVVSAPVKTVVKAVDKVTPKVVDKAVEKSFNSAKKIVQKNLSLSKLAEITDKVVDSTLNSIPVISTINQTLETVGLDVSKIPATVQKVTMQKGVNLIKDAVKSTSHNKTADGNNTTGNTGVFISFVKSHAGLYPFGLTENQLYIMNPDELYEVVKNFITENGLPLQVKKCDSVIDADSAKIYYYISGQPEYNALSDVAYKSIRTISKDFDALVSDVANKVQTGENTEIKKSDIPVAPIIAGVAVVGFLMMKKGR